MSVHHVRWFIRTSFESLLSYRDGSLIFDDRVHSLDFTLLIKLEILLFVWIDETVFVYHRHHHQYTGRVLPKTQRGESIYKFIQLLQWDQLWQLKKNLLFHTRPAISVKQMLLYYANQANFNFKLRKWRKTSSWIRSAKF